MARTITGPGTPRPGLLALTACTLLACGTAALADVGPAAAYEPLNRCVSPDNGLPTVQQLSFSPASVDVTSGPVQVTVRMRIVDPGGPGAASGVASAAVSLAPDNLLLGRLVRLQRDGGGWWSGSVTVPQHAPDGAWRPFALALEDRAGNPPSEEVRRALDAHDPPFDQTLVVTSSPDTRPPTVTGVRVSPGRVDTRRGAKYVGVTIAASDDLSGVAHVRVLASRGRYDARTDLRRDGGSFTGRLRIPTWRGTGTWHLLVTAQDRVGNKVDVPSSRLATVGESSFAVVSRKDTARPTLRSLRVDPARVDLRQRARTVAFTVRLADVRSGIRSAVVTMPVSTHGEPGQAMTRVRLTRTAGTARHGTWTGHVRLAPCTLLYRRTPVFVAARDRAGNDRLWRPTVLTARTQSLWPAQADLTTPVVGATGPITLTFSQAVTGINPASPTVRRSDSTGTGPPLAGTWTCFTGSGMTTSCPTGHVRTASWTPDVPLDSPASYRVDLNPEGNLDVTDLDGNPFRRNRCTASTRPDVPSGQTPVRCSREDEGY